MPCRLNMVSSVKPDHEDFTNTGMDSLHSMAYGIPASNTPFLSQCIQLTKPFPPRYLSPLPRPTALSSTHLTPSSNHSTNLSGSSPIDRQKHVSYVLLTKTLTPLRNAVGEQEAPAGNFGAISVPILELYTPYEGAECAEY